MRFSAEQPVVSSMNTICRVLIILWSVGSLTAFSPDVTSPTRRGIVVGTSSSHLTSCATPFVGVSRRSSTGSTLLQARLSKQSAPSVVSNVTTPTPLATPSAETTKHPNNTFTSNNNKTATTTTKMPHNPLARLQTFRARHTAGDNITQEQCDNMLSWCVAQDEWDSVLDVLDIMKSRNLSQVRSTYRACLQACFERPNAASAIEILTAMEQAGMQPEPADIAVTVATMCRPSLNSKGQKGGSWWRKALQLVQTSESLPVQAYDAVLARLTEEHQWKDACRLLRQMEQGLAEPALSTYRLTIECCVESRQAEQALQILQSCVKRGLTPTVYSFELVVAALSRKMQWRRAVQLLALMDDLGIPKTLVIYNSVLSACAKAKEVVQAKNLLVQMRKSGIQPDVISYNNVMAACASTSRWKDALAVMDQCHRAPGVMPDIYTYTNAMRACAKGGMTRRALTLFQVAKDLNLPVDTYFYTAAIEACSKAKMWKQALAMLDEMETKGIRPSEVTYSVTISACGNGGQWSKALDLLEVMREQNMSIHIITYNSAITALSKAAKQSVRGHANGDGELWTKVMGLLGQMKADGIEPDGFSFTSAISCCGAEGRWEEALKLMEIMQKGGPRTRPNKVAYTATIAACGRSGKVDHALRLFRQMKDQGLAADRVAYNAVFSALRVAGRGDAANDLWDEMCGTKQVNTTQIATAKPDRFTTPDIITVSEVIAAMSAHDSKESREQVDRVFVEAVRRGIVLRTDTLDSQSEFDLSGMAFPIGRAACRYIVNRVLENEEDDHCFKDLTFITGVGVSRAHRQTTSGQVHEESSHTTLREYVQDMLSSDYDPPIASFVPQRAQGTVQIDAKTLEDYSRQKKS